MRKTNENQSNNSQKKEKECGKASGKSSKNCK